MANENLIRIGLGNYVLTSRLIAVLNPASSPMRRLKEDAKSENKLIDATQGRKTRAILVLDSNHVILSSISPETLKHRFMESMGRAESEVNSEEFMDDED